VIIPVVREDRHFLPEVEQFPGLDAFAIACAPIFAQGRAIGVLEAINPLAGSFDPDALLVLAGIGNLAGSAIQHAQLFERLQVAHKRYRELFDDSIDPILVTDWDGKIVESNRQAAVCSGYPSAQLRGMTIEDLGAVLRSEQGACLERLKAGETCSYESSLKTRTGARLPIYVYVRRAAFEDVDTLQWTLRDIRERKELDNLREDLISMIYHDVRSPLANIVSSLDMLAAMFPEDQGDSARPVLDIARRAAERIQRLINSLLDISRLESGQAIVSQQAVLPGMLAKEAAESVQPLVDSRGQTLALALPDRLPLVWIDPDMIRRVLINLLENAAKFTPAGGKMEIGARRKGEWVEIWVQDTGPGIPLQDQEHIFEKFTRLKQEEYKSGTGVGLAFCRLAVHGHGGKIWVENRPAGGARFLLTLPVARG
jgi:PAS domain S-box-containing protein